MWNGAKLFAKDDMAGTWQEVIVVYRCRPRSREKQQSFGIFAYDRK